MNSFPEALKEGQRLKKPKSKEEIEEAIREYFKKGVWNNDGIFITNLFIFVVPTSRLKTLKKHISQGLWKFENNTLFKLVPIKKNIPIPVEHTEEEWRNIAKNIYNEKWENIYSIRKNVIEKKWKIIPPISERYQIIWEAHLALNHRSKNFVYYHLQKTYYWNGMIDDISFVLKHCKLCLEKRSDSKFGKSFKVCVSNGPNDLYEIDLTYFVEVSVNLTLLIIC